MLLLLPFLSLTAFAEADDDSTNVRSTSQTEACEGNLEVRAPRWSLPIYRSPDTQSPMRGRLLINEAFYVVERVEGRGCNRNEG